VGDEIRGDPESRFATPNISRVMTFRFCIPKMMTRQVGFLEPFLNCQNREVTINAKDRQRSVIEFRVIERCAGEEIMICLRNVYGSSACCRASIFRGISELCRGNEELRKEGRPGKRHRQETHAAIRSILQDDPNASLRAIAETLSISPDTIRTHVRRMGYTLTNLHWIAHALIYELKQVHLTMCVQLLPKARAHADDNSLHLVMGDKSLFYDDYIRDRIWAARDENTPEVQKSMLTVSGNSHRFQFVIMLPPKTLLNE
jgi:hypothetical protein